MDALRAEYRPIYQATYGEYQEARSQLLTRQQGERDQLKAMWAARHEDRRQALQQLRSETGRPAVDRSDEWRDAASERIGERDARKTGTLPGESEQQQRTSPAMKPPSEDRSSSPVLPDSALVRHLDDHHRDPFDRLLVAQAKCETVPLVSKDQWLQSYGVEVVW